MTTLSLDTQIDFGYLHTTAPSSYVSFWDRVLENKYAYQSASISSDVDRVLNFLSQSGVSVEDTSAVESCLANYAGVVAHLYDAPERISHYFATARLNLGALSDPDSGDNHEELYLEIETNLSAQDANNRLSQINRDWLIASGDQDLMSLNLTLRFI